MSTILLDKNCASIQFLRNQGEDYDILVAAFIVKMLEEAAQNFPNTFNGNYSDCAYAIMNEYEEYLKPEEIIIILRNGIAAKYGRIFHAISTEHVMEWVSLYVNGDRLNWFENEKSRNRDNNSKEEIISVKPEVKEKLKSLAESLKNPTLKPDSQETVYKKQVRELFDEFYKTAELIHGLKFKKYNEKFMTAEEYVSAKIKELYPEEIKQAEEYRNQLKQKR